MIQCQIPLVSTTGGLADTVIDGYTGLQMGAFSVEVSTLIVSDPCHIIPSNLFSVSFGIHVLEFACCLPV